jgi:ABC-type nitrate/sulfonate/bicarbonate transport system ATPase subunit
VGQHAVELRDVRHHFRRRADEVEVLDGVSLTVDAGQFVSIVGPSGCGKSTLLRIVAGVLRPTAGEVFVDGVDVAGRPGAVAFQPQRDLLLPWRRTIGNAILGAEVNGVPRADAVAAARRQLERFGLSGFERSWPAQLSGGMRQRLALLRTVLTPRSTTLLDEPFGALDALTRRELQMWLQDVWATEARSTILVTHDVDEALLLSDLVVVMSPRPGRVVAELRSDFARPRRQELVTDPAFVARKADVLDALAGVR